MNRPLQSLKVLDFTTLLPGPFATMIMADLGADVLRIEAPHRPDWVRALPPFDGDTSAWHAVLNRSKRSLALNLKKGGAADIVKRLIRQGGYDIVVEQFRPGVMERLGIGYEDLRAVKEALIYCSITGYGQSGPLRDRAGHDINFLALSGLMSHSGRRAEGPALMGVQVADIGGGSFGALVGLLSAVIQRQESGLGQMVDISMLDMMLAWQTHIYSQHFAGQERIAREDGLLNGGGPYDFYATADGRYLAVGSLEPKFWTAFCAALDRPDLAALAYDDDRQTREALKAEVRRLIAARPLQEWVARFEPEDACVEPVLTTGEAIDQAQVAARQMVVDVPRADGTVQKQIGSPFHFSGSAAVYKFTGAAVGANSADVLAEIGYQEEEITALREKGVLG